MQFLRFHFVLDDLHNFLWSFAFLFNLIISLLIFPEKKNQSKWKKKHQSAGIMILFAMNSEIKLERIDSFIIWTFCSMISYIPAFMSSFSYLSNVLHVLYRVFIYPLLEIALGIWYYILTTEFIFKFICKCFVVGIWKYNFYLLIHPETYLTKIIY